MRLIVVGCEYVGKTTFIKELEKWAKEKCINLHAHSHFTVPRKEWTEKDNKTFMEMSPGFRESFKRYEMEYHVLIMQLDDNIILEGFHIENAVYAPLYYGYTPPSFWYGEEALNKLGVILVLLKASPEAVWKRMEENPHRFQCIKKEDVPTILKRFEEEFENNRLRKKIGIDTTDITPKETLDVFVASVVTFLTADDLARINLNWKGKVSWKGDIDTGVLEGM